MNEPTSAGTGDSEIRRLQESVAFLERRLDEYALVADELSARLEQAVRRVAALETGTDRLKQDLIQLKDGDQSGPGHSG